MKLTRFYNSNSDIALSVKEFAILDAVQEFGSPGATCADLQRKIKAETESEPRLATLYSVLSRLEAKGLIEPHEALQHNGGRPRQVFRITEGGRRALRVGQSIAARHPHPIPA